MNAREWNNANAQFQLVPLPQNISRQQRREFSRECMAQHLSMRLQYKVQATEIDYAESGQPFLRNGEFNLSMSHSGNWLALMSAHCACGIDIEYQRAKRNYAGIWQAIRHPHEPKQLQNSADFYKCWVRKEAIWKVFSCLMPERMSDIHVFEPQYSSNLPVWVSNLVAPSGYAFAVALQQ